MPSAWKAKENLELLLFLLLGLLSIFRFLPMLTSIWEYHELFWYFRILLRILVSFHNSKIFLSFQSMMRNWKWKLKKKNEKIEKFYNFKNWKKYNLGLPLLRKAFVKPLFYLFYRGHWWGWGREMLENGQNHQIYAINCGIL